MWLVEHIILGPSLTSAILKHTRGKTDALKEFKSAFKKYDELDGKTREARLTWAENLEYRGGVVQPHLHY